MIRSVLIRLSSALLSLAMISLLFFFLSKAIPGDPVDVYLKSIDNDQSTVQYKEEYRMMKQKLGLDLPLFYFSIVPKNYPLNRANVTRAELKNERKEFLKKQGFHVPSFYWHGISNQYHHWLFHPSDSIIDGRSAYEKISRALVWTLFLVITSLVFSYSIGILLGVFLSTLKHKRLETFLETILFGMYSLPVFWLATLLLVFFTTKEYGAWTNIFPSVGLPPIDLGEPWYQRIAMYGKQLILPCFILTLHNLAFISTLTKRNVKKTAQLDFVKTARAFGFSKKEILWKDILPYCLIPLITSFTSAVPSAIGGSLVIEIIFNIPGTGRLLYQSILNYDWAVVFPIVLLIAFVSFISFALADILYRAVDPRIRT